MKTISLIYAVSENGVIGLNGHLPWHLPDDFRHFKDLTLGHPIIMGSRTYEGLGRPLPGRQNIVLTQDPDYHRHGVQVAHSLDEAIDMAESDNVFVIGGAKVFQAALPRASRIYETRVHATVAGDTFFDPDLSHWLEESSQKHPADERHEYGFTYVTWEREG
jgi:dihydrofolate reductase